MQPLDLKTVSPLPTEIVEELIDRWNGEKGTASCMNVGTNVVFRFRADGRDLILRVHHTGDRKREGIEAEVTWVDFLHEHGASVAAPVASVGGEWVETAEWEGKILIAAVFQKVPGQHPQLHTGTRWRGRLIRRIGRTLGRM